MGASWLQAIGVEHDRLETDTRSAISGMDAFAAAIVETHWRVDDVPCSRNNPNVTGNRGLRACHVADKISWVVQAT